MIFEVGQQVVKIVARGRRAANRPDLLVAAAATVARRLADRSASADSPRIAP